MKHISRQLCSDIISFNSHYGVRTRGQISRSTVSCRIWQLIVAILDNLSDDEHEYYELVKICSDVIDQVKRNNVLQSLIYLNHPIPSEIKKHDDTAQLELGNNYMCVYVEDTMIFHYFTVIKTIDNKYYLNSSYKSDYVCVPQYTTALKLDELTRFANALINFDDKYTSKFIKKFFLKGNMSTYSEEQKFKHIKPDEGNEREIAVYTNNECKNRIRCGIITKYTDHIKLCIYTYYTSNEGMSTR
jgi:hypothetical protein